MVGLLSEEDNLDYIAAETRMIGFDHTQAGYELAKSWKLPDELAEVILYHHNPADASEENRMLVYAVHLGDNIAMLGGFGTGADSMRHKLDSGYADYISLSPKMLASIMLAVDMEFEKLEESFSASGEEN